MKFKNIKKKSRDIKAEAKSKKQAVREKDVKEKEIATLPRDDMLKKEEKKKSPRNYRVITEKPIKEAKPRRFLTSFEMTKAWTRFYRFVSPQEHLLLRSGALRSRMTLNLDKSLPWIVSGILGVGIIIGLIGTLVVYQQLNAVKQQRQEVVDEFTKWQQFTQEHPGYRDGYVQLAELSYRLGNVSESRQYVSKALELDPNFEPAIELQKKIE
jgi:tetratricopeptide (TPR) repeat protein